MLIIFLFLSYEHCGCYGKGNSQIVAKHMGPEITKTTIQASFMKLGMWTGGNVLIMHIFFEPSSENSGWDGSSLVEPVLS